MKSSRAHRKRKKSRVPIIECAVQLDECFTSSRKRGRTSYGGAGGGLHLKRGGFPLGHLFCPASPNPWNEIKKRRPGRTEKPLSKTNLGGDPERLISKEKSSILPPTEPPCFLRKAYLKNQGELDSKGKRQFRTEGTPKLLRKRKGC